MKKAGLKCSVGRFNTKIMKTNLELCMHKRVDLLVSTGINYRDVSCLLLFSIPKGRFIGGRWCNLF